MVLGLNYTPVLDIQRFHHRPAEEPLPLDFTRFDDGISTQNDRLTLIIRTDAQFATRDIRTAFASNAFGISARQSPNLSTECFGKILETTYAPWGTEVVNLWAATLDYERRYNISRSSPRVHIHSADTLASNVIKKARDLRHNDPKTLYLSLDEMIRKEVFDSSGTSGAFAEIGFSRLFSPDGKQLGYTGRPGREPLDDQILSLKALLAKMRGNDKERISIVLLEDNVRHARQLNFIIEKMREGGVFQHGRLALLATCLCVADPDERAKIQFEGCPLPLVVGADYKGSKVDVITTRDNFFDGLVVANKGGLGRCPSFMLGQKEIADSFKIQPEAVEQFRTGVIEANLRYCDDVETLSSVTLPVGSFTTGKTIASVLGLAPNSPMVDVLEKRQSALRRQAQPG